MDSEGSTLNRLIYGSRTGWTIIAFPLRVGGHEMAIVLNRTVVTVRQKPQIRGLKNVVSSLDAMRLGPHGQQRYGGC